MRKILVSLLLCLFSLQAWAQTPEKISYQAVVRDNANLLVADKVVGMRISILRSSVTGTPAYVETQSPRSNVNGLVTLEIGAGTVVSGSFTGLNWSSGPYFIQTEIDPSGGSNYGILGVSQLVSVPYALYAKTSGSSTPGPAGPAGTIGATGPIGPAGVAGAAGTNGSAGPQGIKGDTGATGPIGPAGADGTNGTNGANGGVGSNGLDGKTVINGTSNPATGQGVIGDFYINTATSTLFGPKASGGWPTGISLVGAAGIQGIQGAAGADGTNGATGTNGTNGLDGKTVLNGTVDPTNQGNDGDFYINTTASMLFGPKVSGVWPSGVFLIGATGIQGIQGVTGVVGPAPSGTGIVTVDSGTLRTPSGLTGDVTTTGAGLETTIGTGAVTSNKILDGTIATADLANSAVTDEKIAGVAGSKVSGNITGNAANVTGTVAVVNGGTGATTLTGLVKGNGTDAMTAAVAGTDYQAPLVLTTTTGSGAATLTGAVLNIPTLAAGTADGDMLYWKGGAWVKVAAGTDGQTITFIGGKPVWTGSLPANTVVNATTGKIWMDRDLGASRVATGSKDHLAYGSLYQWGRGSDGHQLINWSNSTTGVSVNSATGIRTDTPGDRFIVLSNVNDNDWRITQNDNLWQGVSGVNNPCPGGYRIPTLAEWDGEYLTWTVTDNIGFDSPLKLPSAGRRLHNDIGSLSEVGDRGWYWTSNISGLYVISVSSDGSMSGASFRASGRSVRCIKD